MNDLPGEFARLQTDGYLGDPKGQNAYAYLRASSERQVEEGSSFPRQIENIHKAAVRDHLRISYGMIFFDDGFTGFEFEHRPALLRLRHEVSQKPRAHYLVVEDIDRLSRNSDWQQGFLLDELSRHHVQTHFFIDPGSQLERYVRGYIAQEGMRKDIERMRMGSVYKAMDGRVTARRPKYGYILTDKKNTHYELHPIESKIVREIYERIIYKNESLSSICRWLNDAGIPTSLNGAWAVATVYRLVKSPIYKGEFYANRVQTVKTGKFTKNNRPERRDKIRPKEEWIKVQVPAIVTPQEWDASHEMMKKNSKASLRNGKYKGWLLQGLVKCGLCRKYVMRAQYSRWNAKYYVCNMRSSEKARKEGNKCDNPYAPAELLESKVWEKVEEVIYDPSIIIKRLEARHTKDNGLQGLQRQVEYVEGELAKLERERKKYEAAYHRDIYTLDEFEEKMKNIAGKAKTLEVSKASLQAKLAEEHSIEEKKKTVLGALGRLRKQIPDRKDIPFDLKRKLLALLVDVIYVDAHKREFTIEGEIKGTYSYAEDTKGGGSGGGNLGSRAAADVNPNVMFSLTGKY